MSNEELLTLFIDPLTWDKESYKFIREEKDVRPYPVTNTKKETIITHNVLGINKKDLKLTMKSNREGMFLIVEGATKDSLTGKDYSVNSTFQLDDTQLDLTKISSKMENGLLYIIIPNKAEEIKPQTFKIEIL
jgi:HSP20 family molecular chaperone IbpA